MPIDCSLSLTLFGPVALHRVAPRGTPLRVALSAQSRNLLAFLALSRGSCRSRSDLAQSLWDEAGGPARAGSVNTALWRLRAAIEQPPFDTGDVICAQRGGQISLRPDAPMQIDVEDYLRHVLPVLALPLERVTPDDAERLRQGTAMYSAELLQGLQDDWALRERERLRRHQLNALDRLMQWHALKGDAVGGIRHALAILEIDALREDVHRSLMRLYLRAGQRALALRQYEHCRAALKRELSIVPMPETRDLYQRIADGAIGALNTAMPPTMDRAMAPAEPVPAALLPPRPPVPIAPAVGLIAPLSPPAVSDLLDKAHRHLAAADRQVLLARAAAGKTRR
ncbi:hypothetical protein CDN99_12055 [Roseateles aquatilis]|uniref:Bacterial transcriptional activator domain-containing protein n=1 Tax=Roseateles aquatilis TaxID=431061 RepID=A0A246JEH6_9BURK|nr:BTAD domain-containing putative transcriptional regulator [Roseateles aquatilis]OWQ90887.1 hypothetical protein CDN99_12055 [Roseateles aquatilis]